MLRVSLGLTAVMLVVGVPEAAPQGEESFALIVTGASGGEEYAATYAEWRRELVTALRSQAGFRDDHLLVLSETPGGGVGLASREGVRQALETVRGRMGEHSVLLIALFGHGTYDGVDAKFNLVGPDLDAGEWSRMLDAVPGWVVFVNTTAASFPFLQRVSGTRRIVVTATASPMQRYDTVFPSFFVEALGAGRTVADGDRDGRVSVWEAFAFASAEVRRWFQRQGRLATERGVLDDTGDGRGREADDEEDGPDGHIAARVFVGAGVTPPVVTDPEVLPLVERRERLVGEIASLRDRKTQLAETEYQQALEALLVELARVSREIRRRAG